jgi:hypothetical protein
MQADNSRDRSGSGTGITVPNPPAALSHGLRNQYSCGGFPQTFNMGAQDVTERCISSNVLRHGFAEQVRGRKWLPASFSIMASAFPSADSRGNTRVFPPVHFVSKYYLAPIRGMAIRPLPIAVTPTRCPSIRQSFERGRPEAAGKFAS